VVATWNLSNKAGLTSFSLDVFPRLIGFVVSICRVPLFGFKVKLAESFAITVTVISIIRSYFVHRFFAAWCERIVALIPEY
jgi:hypothetical protein